jgi:hypothetical protein
MKCDTPPLPTHVRDFWHSLFLLAQSDRLELDALKGLAQDSYLRERPEILSDMASWILPKSEQPLLESYAPQPAAPPAPPLQQNGWWRRLARKVKNRLASLVK